MSAWDVGGPVWGLEAGPGSKTSPAPPIPIPAGLPGCGSLSPRSCEPPPPDAEEVNTRSESAATRGHSNQGLGVPKPALCPAAEQHVCSTVCMRSRSAPAHEATRARHHRSKAPAPSPCKPDGGDADVLLGKTRQG